MKHHRLSVKPFYAVINLGLQYHYNPEKKIKEKEVIKDIRKYQDRLIEKKGIYLSCSIVKSKIVLSGQVEKHLKIGFLNYPKFKLKPKTLKKEIEKLARNLMNRFDQNRIVIEYHDEIVMYEKTEEIDQRIKIK